MICRRRATLLRHYVYFRAADTLAADAAKMLAAMMLRDSAIRRAFAYADARCELIRRYDAADAMPHDAIAGIAASVMLPP